MTRFFIFPLLLLLGLISACSESASSHSNPGNGDWDGDETTDDDSWPDIDTGILGPRVRPVEAFPYQYENDDPALENPESAYLFYRAEGKTPEENLEHGWEYLQKYETKKWTAPSAEIDYFERQRNIFSVLKSQTETQENAVRMGLVGDIMWIGDGWDSFLSDELLQDMQSEDVWLGNLETPISKSSEVPSGMPSYLEFNAPPELVRAFHDSQGESLFSALSFANNHSLDYGDLACEETLAFLEEENIPSVGARLQPGSRWVEFEKNGLSFGVYAASWGLNDPQLLETTAIDLDVIDGLAPEKEKPVDLEEVREVLEEMASRNVDFKIVLLHWGHEYELYPSPIQLVVVREIVFAGADVIVGAHPHVMQPPEVCFVNGYEKNYDDSTLNELDAGSACVLSGAAGPPRKALVLYSLGNFATAMSTIPCRLGLMMHLNVFFEKDKADWSLSKASFAYNIKEFPPDDTHFLMRLQAFLDSNCGPEFEDGCPESFLDELETIRHHFFHLDEN